MNAKDKRRKKRQAKKLASIARREHTKQSNAPAKAPAAPEPSGRAPAIRAQANSPLELPVAAAADNFFIMTPAREWLERLILPDAPDLLTQALWDSEIPIPRGYKLNAATSMRILAAAEVVAAGIGRPSSFLPPNVAAWISKKNLLYSPGIVALAISAVERVATESELRDLWQAVETIDRFHQGINNLLGRLRNHDFEEWKLMFGELPL